MGADARIGKERMMPKNNKPKKPKVRAVRIPEGTPMPKSAEDLARAMFNQADRKMLARRDGV